jgi:hypothetical protein
LAKEWGFDSNAASHAPTRNYIVDFICFEHKLIVKISTAGSMRSARLIATAMRGCKRGLSDFAFFE